jgi:hypothetical protein
MILLQISEIPNFTVCSEHNVDQARKREGEKKGSDPSPHPFPGKGSGQKFREAKGKRRDEN